MPFFVLPPHPYFIYLLLINYIILYISINAERKSKVDDNTARMQSIKQLGV
ncbi:hypothetical protein GKD20_04795 [Parabacteroides distasonis]|uniref:Uncharacterized protein n=1 Tax=Parabacteroides distasonis TaxID=823 RepID=A0A7K0HGR4_PARDI|nr:hypothetical protein [Parabacteroides distasonis]MRY25577.1 hypothetical protein [Parabacteroides distasonis]MRY44277.1 hypothetical protein [Parabacteroides distasonis]MRY53244.1 hypothetical protein [Parabacteroides distasonis]MRZ45571.1 hypothetical protein [Parabacteroides distasonis]